MTYKNTIEIVTKDIQEIEKLVGNFKNYSSIPSIELDLALSRLRNVYEILLMLKDNKSEVLPENLIFIEEKDTGQREEKPGPKEKEKTEEPVTIQKHAGKEHEKVKKDIPVSGEEKDNEIIEDELITSGKPLKTFTEAEENQTKQENVVPLSPVKPPTKKSKPADPILGETFRDSKAYIYDKLEEQSRKSDLTTKLQSSPIQSISGNIGINDKFLFIRELFSGNAEKFRETVDILDNSHNFNEAYNYLIEHFEWEMESETVQQLLNLIRRKFISREDE